MGEDAVRDMFELLNSYILNDEDKFKFGDDAIDSVEKLEVAQKRLEELRQEQEKVAEDLKKAEEELAEAQGSDKEAEKAQQVEELRNRQQELADESERLAKAIDTANTAMEQDVEVPQTLEEAIAQIKEYQEAIKTLEEQGIKPPVERKRTINPCSQRGKIGLHSIIPWEEIINISIRISRKAFREDR